jgi:hypothetical protein
LGSDRASILAAAGFLLYVQKVLTPTLRPSDLVIADNLGSHKSTAAAMKVIRENAHAGC